MRLLVPVPEHTDAARTSFLPLASLGEGLRESPGAQPVGVCPVFWPCKRQIGISLPLTHLAHGYEHRLCCHRPRSWILVGLDGQSPRGSTVGGGRMFTSGMMRVSVTGMSLVNLVMRVRDPRRGLRAETPQAGGSSADGRVPWKWGVQLELVPVMIWQFPLQIESGFFHESDVKIVAKSIRDRVALIQWRRKRIWPALQPQEQRELGSPDKARGPPTPLQVQVTYHSQAGLPSPGCPPAHTWPHPTSIHGYKLHSSTRGSRHPGPASFSLLV